MSPPLRKKILARLQTPANQATSRMVQQQRRRDTAGGWSALAFVVVVLIICVSPNLFQKMPAVPVGATWPFTSLVTPYELTVPDPEAEDSMRRRIEQNHKKVFHYRENLEKEIAGWNRQLISYLGEAGETSRPATLRGEVRKRFGVDLQDPTIATLVEQANTSRTLSDLDTIFHHLLTVRGVSTDKSLLSASIRSDRALVLTSSGQRVTSTSLRQVISYPDEAFSYLSNAYLATFQIPQDIRNAYGDLTRQVLKPNIAFNREETDKRRMLDLASVNVQRKMPVGSVVLRRGEQMNGMAATALKEIADRERHNDVLRVLGGSLVVLLVVAFTFLYARRFNQDLPFTSRSVLLVALPVVFAVSLGRVILNLGGGYLLGAFAMPAGMVGILTVMIFDERFAIVLTTMACVLFSVATGFSYPYAIIGMVGGYTAIISLRNLQERREVLFTGLYIALANCIMALAVSLIMSPSDPQLQAVLIAALVNGLVCYMLAVAALPIFENIFQITTDVLLLELTGANHKLLKLMEERAPGSLHHSMNVASLAEAAAEAVGAHYLLVRAGAYFHDIGKMIKPNYFTENQSTPEQKQIHGKLSPAMSTLIIKNHVKEGIELARSYRLPERVIDFIPEHHGTGLIKYFYVQALKKAEQEGSDEIISEEEYRYPGPKPQSVETAILLLADSVEAISTSRFAGKTPDETEIRRAVHEAVAEKYEDRQLNNSPLTFRDMEIIKEAFVRVLQNRFHQRVKYPTMPGRPAALPIKIPVPKAQPVGSQN